MSSRDAAKPQGNASSSADRWRLWPVLALVAVPLLGLIALQGHQALSQAPRTVVSEQLVAHSFEVIVTAQSLRSALQDAERGQRGYLLTGQPGYLEPYQAALRSAPPLLRRLTALTADEPDQQQQIAGLVRPIDAKLDELRRTIAAYRTAGFPAARSIVETNAGLDAMRSIEIGIDKVVATESRQRSLRLAGLAAQERTMEHVDMASALLVLILALSGVVLAAQANRQLERRNIELASAGALAREAKEAARRAEKQKGRFLATASHDLRQPLQAVSLLNGTLRRMTSDPEIKDALRQQAAAIGSMSQLLNTLLDISKLDAGVIRPEPGTIPVSRVLARMEQEFRGIARSKGLELQVIACQAHVQTDPALLERILRNLLSNAIKYTHRGWVRLRAVEDPPWVNLEVIDSGVGIPTDQIRMICDEFYQIGVPSNSTREGYGLGLSIVQRLVKLLGLELQVRSEVGQGSVFSVRLRQGAGVPAPEQPEVAATGIRQAPTVKVNILLVEDDPDVRNATLMLLRTEGYEVLTAASFAEALQRLRQGPSVDLLITDFHLADGETGVQVISRLRQQLRATLKTVLITGDTSAAVKELAHDPNLRIVSKPVQAEAFLELVRALLAA